MYHWEKGDDGNLKIKTNGKMIDNHITLEGLFTVVLYTETTVKDKKMEYGFIVNNDGTKNAKSPIGMFPSQKIPNDLGYVVDKVTEYYNG